MTATADRPVEPNPKCAECLGTGFYGAYGRGGRWIQGIQPCDCTVRGGTSMETSWGGTRELDRRLDKHHIEHAYQVMFLHALDLERRLNAGLPHVEHGETPEKGTVEAALTLADILKKTPPAPAGSTLRACEEAVKALDAEVHRLRASRGLDQIGSAVSAGDTHNSIADLPRPWTYRIVRVGEIVLPTDEFKCSGIWVPAECTAGEKVQVHWAPHRRRVAL